MYSIFWKRAETECDVGTVHCGIQSRCTGNQLLIVIIDATWNVNACCFEVSYAWARSFQDGKSNMFCSCENKQAEFTKSASTLICKILLCFHMKSIGIVLQLMVYKVDW